MIKPRKMFLNELHAVLCCFVLALATICVRAGDVSMADYPRLGGETDDAPRIGRAIAAAGSGGQVFFPSATYVLATTTSGYPGENYHIFLASKTNLTLRGVGPSSVLQSQVTSGANYGPTDAILIGVYNSSDIAIRDLSFVGQGKGYAQDSDWGAGVTIYNSTRVAVRDCSFQNLNCGIGKGGNYDYGQFLDNRIFGKIAQDSILAWDRCVVRGNLIDGGSSKTVSMGVRVTGSETVVAQNIIRHVSAEPIVMEGNLNSGISIANNAIENPGGYGIVARLMVNSVILGNTITGGDLELQAGNGTGSNSPVNNNVVLGNNMTNGGIYVAGNTAINSPAQHNLLANNIDSGSPVYGFLANGGADYTSLIGNQILSAQQDAIEWSSPYGMVVNYVDQPLWRGFWTVLSPALQGMFLADNKFTRGPNNTQPAIVMNGANDSYVAQNDLGAGFSASYYGSGNNNFFTARAGRNVGFNVAAPTASLSANGINNTAGNLQPVVTIPPGASPYTWVNTTGLSVLLWVGGGTVSSITVNGASAFVSSNHDIPLQNGEYVTVTYSAAPVMLYKESP
jgi:hypothetical protein